MIDISRESEINLINILIDQDIISGKDLVREFLQADANVENFVSETSSWFAKEGFSPYYHELKKNLEDFSQSFATHPSYKLAAEEIEKDLGLLESKAEKVSWKASS